MADVHPIIAVLTALGSIAGAVKGLAEARKRYEAKKLDRAYKASEPSVELKPPPPPLEHSPQVQLEAKHIELLRAKYQIEELEQALRRVRAEHEQTVRRMRQALDEAAVDQARLAAAISEERAANEHLLAEMAELRKTGGHDDARDDRVADPPPRRGVHGPVGGGDRLRATRRPQRGKGD